MVYAYCLENSRPVKGSGGSNPSPSATFLSKPSHKTQEHEESPAEYGFSVYRRPARAHSIRLLWRYAWRYTPRRGGGIRIWGSMKLKDGDLPRCQGEGGSRQAHRRSWALSSGDSVGRKALGMEVAPRWKAQDYGAGELPGRFLAPSPGRVTYDGTTLTLLLSEPNTGKTFIWSKVVDCRHCLAVTRPSWASQSARVN